MSLFNGKIFCDNCDNTKEIKEKYVHFHNILGLLCYKCRKIERKADEGYKYEVDIYWRDEYIQIQEKLTQEIKEVEQEQNNVNAN